jgi:hypothetical protein
VARWSPTPAQVKALIPTRLAGGPFTETTKPTAAEVRMLVDGVEAEIAGDVVGIPRDDCGVPFR